MNPRESNESVRGIVFDIQRGSFHDGPGVRTTVFLKGCPLRCAWCHNPESWSPDIQPACADGRNKTCGREITAGEVLETAVKDRAYYMESGGGLTVSGGEPTQQFEFCLALLRLAREAGIHTCLDTCGFNRPEIFLALLPWVDLFLWDYKATGRERHLELTGVDNELILCNLELLARNRANILLRCPMVPGVNDTPDHFQALAELSRRHPGLKGIELLPYHATGRGKYATLGLPAPALAPHTPSAGDMARWTATLTGLGCPVLA
ncbi:MAG: glycyl-radical enzyme activating protein [Verrucomicrobiota bacterium]